MKTGWIVLGTLGIAGAGYLAYKWMQYKSNGTNGVDPLIQAGNVTYRSAGQNSVQPQPRVDNANQPWYGSSQAAIGGLSQQAYDMKNVATYLDAGSSIVHSLSDIWSDLGVSDLFGKGDSYDLAETDWNSSISWDANDNGMGALDVEGSMTDTDYAYA